MREFRTVLPAKTAPFSIGYPDRLLSLGSCFAENVGLRLQKYKFPIENNPFGILYNPLSLAESLERLRHGPAYQVSDLFQHQGLWHSFDHHGRFSHPDQESALHRINESWQGGRQQLAHCTRLILTFGTAYIFVHKGREKIVANCHKLPNSDFFRRRLHVEEMFDPLARTLAALKADLPGLQVILTVSPVRHLRDGLVENQRSKAALILLSEELCRKMDFVHYFPAYELLLDDLRDYRFYAADLAHPNDLAVDYIWDHFTQTFFDPATLQIVGRIEKILRAAAHRPLHPEREAHRQFIVQQIENISQLTKQFPFLDFAEERTIFSSQLTEG